MRTLLIKIGVILVGITFITTLVASAFYPGSFFALKGWALCFYEAMGTLLIGLITHPVQVYPGTGSKLPKTKINRKL